MAPRTSTTKTTLLIDIAHNSVGVGVLITGGSLKPRLLAAWREHIDVDPSDERMFDRTLRSMRKLVDKANAGGYSAWNDVVCSVGAPWVITQVRTAIAKHEKPIVITERVLNDLDARDTERLFANDIQTGAFAEYTHVVQHERLVTMVNGHVLARPVGHRAREISGTYLLAVMNTDQFNALRSGIYAVTHREPTIQSAQFTLWESLHKFGGVKDVAIFDFHGGFGECLVIRDGVLATTVASPLSENTYIADLAKTLSMSSSELRRTIDMHASGILQDSFSVERKEAEDVLAMRYHSDLLELMQSTAEQVLIPQQVFIVADYAKEFFARLLGLPECADCVVTRQALTPVSFSKQLLSEAIDTHALLKEDNALCLLALSVVTE